MGIRDNKYLFSGFIPGDNKLLIITYSGFLTELNLSDANVQFSNDIDSEISRIVSPYGIEWFIQIDKNKNLLAVNTWGNKIFIYNIDRNNWYGVDIDCHFKAGGNFSDVFAYNDCAYIIPKYRSYMLEIDMKKRKMNQIECSFRKKDRLDDELSCRKGKWVYFFYKKSKMVFIFDLQTKKYTKTIFSGISEDGISIQYYNENFFILSETGKIEIWNENNNKIDTLLNAIKEPNSEYFSELAVTDQNIWLLPAIGNDIYIYDYEEKKYHIYKNYPVGLHYVEYEHYYKYVAGRAYKDKIYFGTHSANYLLCIHRNTGVGEWICPVLPTKEEQEAYKRYHGLSTIETEKELSLNSFIQEVTQISDVRDVGIWKKKELGETIWKSLERP